MEWPLKDFQLDGSSLEISPEDSIYFLNQHLIHNMVSPTSMIHRSRNQRVKKGITELTTTPRNPLGKFLLPRGVSVLELKVHTSPWPLCASDAFKPTGYERNKC